MYFAYSVLLAIAFVLALPVYLWKAGRGRKYLGSFRERIGWRLPSLNAGEGPVVWVHAVSVGEVLVARPVVEALRCRLPGYRIFVSVTTATGMALARQRLAATDGLLFAPFDWRWPVRRALGAIRPSLIVLVETELWPNLIHEARRRGARVAVVNGRISPRSFARYRLVRALLRRVLGEVDLFLMQAEAHAERIRALGAPPERVRVPGNLKFELLEPPPPAEVLRGGHGPLWVAGSTVAGEEEVVLAAFAAVRGGMPSARLLLAPRHPARFAEVAGLVERLGFTCVRRTALGDGPWTGGVLLLDTIGELASAYSLATVVFVGGSLAPAGGHNVLEPAVAGKAVIVGPHMENFQEIADTFLAEDALVQVSGAEELSREISVLLGDEARRNAIGARARALVERHRGALDRTVEALVPLLEAAR